MPARPVVMLVGGPDVDTRLPLMRFLRRDFRVSAIGSDPALGSKFRSAGFSFDTVRLTRQVNPILDLLSLSQMVTIFRRLKPHIAHAFDTKPGVWGCIAARLAGVPVVIGTSTGLGSLYKSDNLLTQPLWLVYRQLQRLACRASDMTIFQNHNDARYFVSTGLVAEDKTIVILGSGVSTDRFSPERITVEERARLRHSLGFQPADIVVTMISRVIRSKGVLDFVETAQEISAHNPNVRFLLVGPDDEESIDRLSQKDLHRLNQVITWPGPRHDIPEVLAASDAFVLPSAYREGIPRTLLEAASMGLPIITTDSPGCNEIVENGVNGFLVPIHDSVALCRAVMRLVKRPELRRRLGLMSRQRVVEGFSLKVVAEQTRLVYQKLLAGVAH